MDSLTQAILKTILYADIFDCALSKKEVIQKLQIAKPVRPNLVEKKLNHLVQQKTLGEQHGYYCLAAHFSLASLRSFRILDYQDKIRQLRSILPFLVWPPWIQGIFLTGSVGAQNSIPEDDIDLMIICSENRLWLGRLWCIAVCEIWGVRRRPGMAHSSNKICLNLFLEPSTLAIQKAYRNLYTAHEVLQANPVWIKESIEQDFWNGNKWVLEYLPNGFKAFKIQNLRFKIGDSRFKIQDSRFKLKSQSSSILNRKLEYELNQKRAIIHSFFPKSLILNLKSSIPNFLLTKLNEICYKLQTRYMQSKKTKEKVSLRSAFFHPRDTKTAILTHFEDRKKQFGLV